MAIGLVGRKLGMTRVFMPDGSSVPVTVVEVQPNYVTQLKTLASDGYNAIQVTTGHRRASRVTSPLAGHYAKAEVGPGLGLWEFRTNDVEKFALGEQIALSIFNEGDSVDVTGISKGKGFAGGVKRHNFRTQDATHGNSRSHRVLGSIGQNQTPGRVFKGKKMAGHLGAVRCTDQSLRIVKIDADKGVILVRGALPGAPGGIVVIKPAVKQKAKTAA